MNKGIGMTIAITVAVALIVSLVTVILMNKNVALSPTQKIATKETYTFYGYGDCPAGWNLIYGGLAASQFYVPEADQLELGNGAGGVICIDKNLFRTNERLPADIRFLASNDLHVEELACAVCSR